MQFKGRTGVEASAIEALEIEALAKAKSSSVLQLLELQCH